jgi:hypothetical protein
MGAENKPTTKGASITSLLFRASFEYPRPWWFSFALWIQFAKLSQSPSLLAAHR